MLILIIFKVTIAKLTFAFGLDKNVRVKTENQYKMLYKL